MNTSESYDSIPNACLVAGAVPTPTAAPLPPAPTLAALLSIPDIGSAPTPRGDIGPSLSFLGGSRPSGIRPLVGRPARPPSRTPAPRPVNKPPYTGLLPRDGATYPLSVASTGGSSGNGGGGRGFRPSLGAATELAIVGTSQPFGTTNNAVASATKCPQRVSRMVDQRPVFLKEGPLRRVCLLTAGSASPVIQTAYGKAPWQALGNTTETLYTTCINLGPQERITGMAVAAGCQLQSMLVVTNRRPGPVRLGAAAPASQYRDVDRPKGLPGAFVAGFSVYLGKPRVVGLQVHWGCYKSGSSCYASRR